MYTLKPMSLCYAVSCCPANPVWDYYHWYYPQYLFMWIYTDTLLLYYQKIQSVMIIPWRRNLCIFRNMLGSYSWLSAFWCLIMLTSRAPWIISSVLYGDLCIFHFWILLCISTLFNFNVYICNKICIYLITPLLPCLVWPLPLKSWRKFPVFYV